MQGTDERAFGFDVAGIVGDLLDELDASASARVVGEGPFDMVGEKGAEGDQADRREREGREDGSVDIRMHDEVLGGWNHSAEVDLSGYYEIVL